MNFEPEIMLRAGFASLVIVVLVLCPADARAQEQDVSPAAIAKPGVLCAATALLWKTHRTPPRTDGLNRYLVISLKDDQKYVQCLFHDKDQQVYCEVSSGKWGPKSEHKPLTLAQLNAVKQLGFSHSTHVKNFVREFTISRSEQIPGLAEFMLDALKQIYGEDEASAMYFMSSMSKDEIRKTVEDECPNGGGLVP